MRARYVAELPPFISIVRYPGRPVILGMETCFDLFSTFLTPGFSLSAPGTFFDFFGILGPKGLNDSCKGPRRLKQNDGFNSHEPQSVGGLHASEKLQRKIVHTSDKMLCTGKLVS